MKYTFIWKIVKFIDTGLVFINCIENIIELYKNF